MRSKHNFAFSKAWTTHTPMLIKTVQATDGPILELGTGFTSTPLLHWLCKDKPRYLLSLESVPFWYDFAHKFQSRNHRIRFVEDWDKADMNRHWSVVLVDHTVERRAIDIIRLKDSADYIVIHDTEDGVYGYDKVWPHFKYRHDWKECIPYTSVISNFKDLKWLN